MAEMRPRYRPGENVPAFAKTAVVGGRFVKIVDDKTTQGDYQIGQCSVAGEYAFGVAEVDSAPATDPVDSVERRINVIRHGAIARVKPGGAITAGGPVKTDTSGQAIAQAGTGTILGYAVQTVAGTEAAVEVDLL